MLEITEQSKEKLTLITGQETHMGMLLCVMIEGEISKKYVEGHVNWPSLMKHVSLSVIPDLRDMGFELVSRTDFTHPEGIGFVFKLEKPQPEKKDSHGNPN